MTTRKRIDDLLGRTKVISISEVRPHPRNPRVGDVDLIAQSIKHHGQFRAVGVSQDGFILFGNHTYMAMMQEGEEQIVVHVLPMNHDDPQALEILAADNRAGDNSTYDYGLLEQLLSQIKVDQGTLEATLFDDKFLEDLLNAEKPTARSDPDDAPVAPENPITEPGDLWLLGRHRLVCGNAAQDESWELLMEGEEKATLVFTDPPYGIGYQAGLTPEQAAAAHRRLDGKEVSGDDEGAILLWRLVQAQLERYSAFGASIYVCAPPGPDVHRFIEALGSDVIHQVLVWVKDQFTFGRSDYHYQHEFILYGWFPGAAHLEIADRTQSSTWEYARPKRSEQHPTMKPVELVQKAIENSSRPTELVLDPFVGSGTTLIAAHLSNRTARCIEVAPPYCDVACQRFQEITGQEPVLVRKGKKKPVNFVSEAVAFA